MTEIKPTLTSKDIEELQGLIGVAEGPDKIKLQRLLKVYKSKVV